MRRRGARVGSNPTGVESIWQRSRQKTRASAGRADDGARVSEMSWVWLPRRKGERRRSTERVGKQRGNAKAERARGRKGGALALVAQRVGDGQKMHLLKDNWSRGVTVSTLDSESSDRGSNPRGTFLRSMDMRVGARSWHGRAGSAGIRGKWSIASACKMVVSRSQEVRCSTVVSITACHAEDPGSVPGGGAMVRASMKVRAQRTRGGSRASDWQADTPSGKSKASGRIPRR